MMRTRAIPQVPVRLERIQLRGGLDTQTPQTEIPPGFARAMENFEQSINGGYSRIAGYERFDGRPSPTSAVWAALNLSAVGAIVVGDTINGQTSGATAVVALVSGTLVVVTKQSGTFTAGENIRKVTTVEGVLTSFAAVTDRVLSATYQLAAANIYRADIAAVPGSGPIRGLFLLNSSLYAIRNNAGATGADMYRSTGGGWTLVSLGEEISFTAGSGLQPVDGATITKGAVSAVVRRVVVLTGTFGAGTAAGYIVISGRTGGNFTAGAFTAGITATASGAQTAITWLPGGRVTVDIGNAGYGVRAYGADGVNRCWEFDGTALVPIRTGLTTDAPLHIKVHKKHVFVGFQASALHSGPGTPYVWSALLGAGEIVVNQNVTGFLVLPGDSQAASLGIFGNDTVSILYGNGSTSWNLVEMNSGVGAKAYTAQALNQSYIFDDLGVVAVEAVQQFGNFASNSLTANLRSFTSERRTLATDSLINREKSQYRVYFSDGRGLYCTILNGRFSGATPVNFPNPALVTCNGESTNGGEVSYFGSSNGFVYRMDVGTSFDGAAIPFTCELAFASQNNTRTPKRYRRAVFEMQGQGYAEFQVGFTLAYGNTDVEQGSLAASVNPVYWDQFTWDAFVWDGRLIAPSQIPLEGTAENISLRIEGNSALWPAFTVNSIVLHYTPRDRLLRAA
jgi:hypothetical protein